ncbi:MAG: NAD-dependent epimerase/dehydratase family protein, partial [Candidatus Kariarchaeum pelagius]
MFDYSQKVVIITGGKGFLGSYLVRKYCELGAIVNVIDNQVNSED